MVNPVNIEIEAISDTQGIVVPDPLTVKGLSAHRASAPKLVAGVAAWTSSDMFKVFVSITNYQHFQILKLLDYWKTKGKKMGS